MMRYGGGRYAEFGVGSITYAMKARSALDAAGIQSDVTKARPGEDADGLRVGNKGQCRSRRRGGKDNALRRDSLQRDYTTVRMTDIGRRL